MPRFQVQPPICPACQGTGTSVWVVCPLCLCEGVVHRDLLIAFRLLYPNGMTTRQRNNAGLKLRWLAHGFPAPKIETFGE